MSRRGIGGREWEAKTEPATELLVRVANFSIPFAFVLKAYPTRLGVCLWATGDDSKAKLRQKTKK